MKLHLGDNLEFMKTLESNSIDLIYCDILYGTGRKFDDYQDLKPIREDIEEHYIPRIKEMFRLLKSTGSIYLQMDTRINHWIRIILDDIFGYDNFRNEISWYYPRWSSKTSKNFQKMHDVILFYSHKGIVNEIRESIKTPKKQNKSDKNGKILKDEFGNTVWNIQTDRIIDDVWHIPFINPNSKERVGYDTQKPKELLERIIKASSNEGDLIADFYLGSGTTAVVSKELNRKFIGCDINPKSIEITSKRLEN